MPKFRAGVEKAKAGPVPEPQRLTVCGLFVAPCVRVSVPLSDAADDGVKVTLMLHEAPAASEPGQELEAAKLGVLIETP